MYFKLTMFSLEMTTHFIRVATALKTEKLPRPLRTGHPLLSSEGVSIILRHVDRYLVTNRDVIILPLYNKGGHNFSVDKIHRGPGSSFPRGRLQNVKSHSISLSIFFSTGVQ